MHWRTYGALCTQIEEQEAVLDNDMALMVERLLDRAPKSRNRP
jgi:hypothetical protein